MMRSTTTQETQQLPPVPSAEAYLPSNGLQALQASKEAQDEIDAPVAESNNINDDSMSITCYDPCTMQSLGSMPAMTAAEVVQRVNRAKAAQQVWANSSFSQRKMFLRILQKYILNNQRTICRVAARDSGKPLVDAAFGEVLVTCEKISWLLTHGERLLQTEYRPPGNMLFYKTARVEYLPLGVVGAIVPWNYPFHNVFNPMLAAVFAGNGIVIKVSEHASWSAKFFQKVIDAALEAAGAPPGLVSLVTGFGDAGAALVTAGIAKMTFVGSTEVGRRVMAAASTTLTPVVLELGGKDPFIVCDDANMKQVVPTALRAAFQSCGQNCVAAERFLVHEAVYKQFADAVAEVARGMRQGPVLQPDVTMDCGAMCMAGSPERVQELVDDAVAKGASLLAGGCLPAAGSQPGQYYPPTVLANVTPQMRIWQEETFGPVLVVAPWKTDEEAVALANDCPYGLGSSVWSEDRTRANAIARQLQAGMAVVNDFASNYMCQSLPFGGVKDSGFDRFAGVEGLRGMCVAKAVCEDRFPALMRTEIPPPLQYPVSDVGFTFVAALCRLFYGLDLRTRLLGLRSLITCFVAPQLARSKKDA